MGIATLNDLERAERRQLELLAELAAARQRVKDLFRLCADADRAVERLHASRTQERDR